MRKALTFFMISFLIQSICISEQYTVNLYFEQHETALTQLFKTQVFPHPIGYHGNDQYNIYLWNPSVDIEPGIVNFNFTIFADAIIGDTNIQYEYPLTLTLDFPNVDVSISGIISFIEGIPGQINGMDGPQWIKDIIISEFEGLNLIVYPNELLEAANSEIPDEIDITVGNFGFLWTAETDLLRFTIFTDVIANPLRIWPQVKNNNGSYDRIFVRLNPSLPVTLYGYDLSTLLGGFHESDYNMNMALTPDTFDGNSFTILLDNYTTGIESWSLELYFGTTYGLWIYSCSFGDDNGWQDPIYSIIPHN